MASPASGNVRKGSVRLPPLRLDARSSHPTKVFKPWAEMSGAPRVKNAFMKRQGAVSCRSGKRGAPHRERSPSILDWLHKQQQGEQQQLDASNNGVEAQDMVEPRHAVEDVTGLAENGMSAMSVRAGGSIMFPWGGASSSQVAAYVARVKNDVAQNRALVNGPWFHPGDPLQTAKAINAKREKDGERRVDAKELLSLVLRPSVFVWAPEEIYQGVRVQCPTCGSTSLRKWWGDERILHGISTQSVYVSRRHSCNSCPSSSQTGKRGVSNNTRGKTFQADSASVLALLPDGVKCAFNFSDMGRILCDAPLADLLRTSATKLSWLSATDAINELKATAWTRDVVLRYHLLCELLNIAPGYVPATLPAQHKLTRKWVRNLYLSDFQSRETEITRELQAETGDAVLKVDWTKSAAARCKTNFVLNVMTGANKVLASVLTATSAPHEAEQILWELQGRGVSPKVVYVDDECCGAWPGIVSRVWPGCCVRLDALHALMRLTKTTASTQHPWHGQFCGMLSDALFTYDKRVLERIHRAMARQRCAKNLTKNQKCKYVPRSIQDAPGIACSIEEVIAKFKEQAHSNMGVLVTASTDTEWNNLRTHVLKGCVCDPPGVDLNSYGENEPLLLGGEAFYPIRKQRGTSSLEGYHSHQKRWLGSLGTHAPEAGLALLTDGNLRWNRQRSNESLPEEEQTPPVFAPGLLQEAQHLQRRRSGSNVNPDLP